MADHFHIFRDCPFVQPYWQELAGEIQTIFGLNLRFSFVTLYLGRIPVGLMERDNYLYKLLLAVSNKAITQKWLQTNLLSRDDWITIINQLQLMENLTFLLKITEICKILGKVEFINSFSSVFDRSICTNITMAYADLAILSGHVYFCIYLFFIVENENQSLTKKKNEYAPPPKKKRHSKC